MAFRLVCLFHETTGLHCPLCGLMRAFGALYHLDVVAALGYNALVVLSLPVAGYLGLRWGLHQLGWLHFDPPQAPRWAVGVLIAVTLAFWAARNIPVYPLTILAP